MGDDHLRRRVDRRLRDVADAGSMVTVLDGTITIGTATVAANGAWSDNVTLANQGANVLTATDTNAAGTGTSNSVTYTLRHHNRSVGPMVAITSAVRGGFRP